MTYTNNIHLSCRDRSPHMKHDKNEKSWERLTPTQQTHRSSFYMYDFEEICQLFFAIWRERSKDQRLFKLQVHQVKFTFELFGARDRIVYCRHNLWQPQLDAHALSRYTWAVRHGAYTLAEAGRSFHGSSCRMEHLRSYDCPGARL